jgi:hypothetical protein
VCKCDSRNDAHPEVATQWLTLKRLRSNDFETCRKAFADATRQRDVEALLMVIEDADDYGKGSKGVKLTPLFAPVYMTLSADVEIKKYI